MASECHLVAMTSMLHIPPKPAGVELIEMNFSIDQNGILHLSATSYSDETNRITLTISKETLNLPEEEMTNMIQRAEE